MISADKSFFELFNNTLAQKLVTTLERLYSGTKPCLLLLSKAFEPLIYNPQIFQTLKASRVRIAFLENINPEIYKPESNNIALLASHNVQSLKQTLTILDAVNNANPGRPFKFFVLIAPRRTFLTKTFLLSNPFVDLFRKVKSVLDLNLDFIPVDNDALTLAFPLSDAEFPFTDKRGYRIFNYLFKQADYNQQLLCAEALEKFQAVFGTFESIATKGAAGDGIYQLLCYSDLNRNKFLNPKNSIFANLLLIDRSTDLITPLITQWTFQGLLDESQGITFGTMKLPKNLITGEEIKKGEKEDSYLNDVLEPYYLIDTNDKLFDRLKDIHWSQAVKTLQETIKSLSELRKKDGNILGKENANKVIELVRVKKFLDIHVYLQTKIEAHLKNSITLEIVKFEQEILYATQPEYFERLIELIQVQLPLENLIKLIMLANFCLRGFTEDQFTRIFKEMIDSYSPSVLKLLLLLEKNGFLVNSEDSDSNLHLIKLNDLDLYKTKFKIINEGINPSNESDLSVAFSGYTPILVRIIENLINPSGKGPKVKFKYSSGASKKEFLERKSLVVFVYGGVSYAELSCIRRLGRLYNKNILVLTTEIINSKSFPKAFIQDLDFK